MSRAESLAKEQVWADRKSVWHLSDVPSLVDVGSGRVWLEMERWIHQHLVAAKVAKVGGVTQGTACHGLWEGVEARPWRPQPVGLSPGAYKELGTEQDRGPLA